MSGQSRPYAIHSDSECDRLERQAILAGLAEHLAMLKGLPPLTSDVGCGSGSMARLLAAKYPDTRVVGVDLRSDYIAYARERARGERLDNLRFEQGDIFNLPFGGSAFDLVWSKYVLQWLKEPAPAVAELRRVTSPGGSVICSNFDGFAVTHWPEDPIVQADAERVFSGLVDPFIGRKMASLFAQAGLTDLAVHFEPDRLFTIVGQIDADRRRNWVEQLAAAPPHIARILGNEGLADEFVETFLSFQDRPDPAAIQVCFSFAGRYPALNELTEIESRDNPIAVPSRRRWIVHRSISLSVGSDSGRCASLACRLRTSIMTEAKKAVLMPNSSSPLTDSSAPIIFQCGCSCRPDAPRAVMESTEYSIASPGVLTAPTSR